MTKTLAKVLGVPFSSNDATPLTMAGYVGEDVDVVIHRLLEVRTPPYSSDIRPILILCG